MIWRFFHNFELRQGAEVFEIDLAVLAPHALYLVDVKGTRGLIDVYGSKWYPEGRQPFHSPLATLRQHAKAMATLIRESNPGLTELRRAHVQATVLLTADDAFVQDQGGLDRPDITDFKHCLKYFRDMTRIPSHRAQDIRRTPRWPRPSRGRPDPAPPPGFSGTGRWRNGWAARNASPSTGPSTP